MVKQKEPVEIKIKNGKKTWFNPRVIISDQKFIQNMNFIADHYHSLRGNNKYNSAGKFYAEQQHGNDREYLNVHKAVIKSLRFAI